MKKTVLITGASSGMGEALVHIFANNGFNVIAVAENETGLRSVVKKAREKHEVEITEIVKDLRKEKAPQQIYDYVKEEDIQIDVLVNDAGVGQKEKFYKTDIKKDVSIVKLNVLALMRLTKLFVKDMVSRGEGKILNFGSIAGFQPGPTMAVYHGSKAFVNSFSEALSDELKDTGVSVTVLCPGPVDTNWFDRADAEESYAHTDMMLKEPEKVAQIAYDGLMDEERIVVPGMDVKIANFMRRLMPKSLQAKMNRKLYENRES